MNAEIIAVGSELLTPDRLDTNSLHITERLNELGIEVRVKAIVGDHRGDLAAVVRSALDRAALVIVTGGLGPTDDDLTRDVVAAVLGVPLREDLRIVDAIRTRFERRGLTMPEVNRRQALVPQGATVLDNPNGTAPGLLMQHEGRTVVLLPGPPRELKPMLDRVLRDHVAASPGLTRFFRRTLRVAGRGESHVEERAQPIYSRWTSGPEPIATTILAAPGDVSLILTAAGPDERASAARLDEATHELLAVLGDDVYSVDGRGLEHVVGDLLRRRRWRIAVAESCTGGLVCARLTDVPGSSDYVELGVVTYSNASKTLLAGVPESLVAEHGAVSEPVALAMAAGVRARAGSAVGVGVTGIAGPGGATATKPVGTVVVAVSTPDRERVRTLMLPGDRTMVRQQASQAALNMVRKLLT